MFQTSGSPCAIGVRGASERIAFLRVIAGEAKGRKLLTVDDPGLRPSGDKLKGAMFSSLGPLVIDAIVLDLFAGSGALGIEALSRGARRCTFVDSDRDAVGVIEQNLQNTRLADRAEVLVLDVATYAAGKARQPADVVVMDPPYAVGPPLDVLGSLLEKGHLHTESVLVLEVSAKQAIDQIPGFEVTKRKQYGGSALIYLRPAGGG